VQSYDLKGVARMVGERVSAARAELVFFGAFYDPAIKRETKLTGIPAPDTSELERLNCVPPSRDPAVREKCDRAYRKLQVWPARELLRLQVRDFVDWLKAQGAI
jgi:hypothetical protein